jgi:hypothetical protein
VVQQPAPPPQAQMAPRPTAAAGAVAAANP